jgi:U3 small nucleolar RNA-associated protein 20
LSEILSTDALVLNTGSLSSSLTAEGLLRFPAGTKQQKSMVEGILDIMTSEFDWEKERDILNATDMKVRFNYEYEGMEYRKLIYF